MQRDWEAERRRLTERLQAARDRMVQLSPAHHSSLSTDQSTNDLVAYDVARAEYDAVVLEAEALNNAKAASGE